MCVCVCVSVSVRVYVYHIYHLVVLRGQSPVDLSHLPSLLSIAFDTSGKLHPVFSYFPTYAKIYIRGEFYKLPYFFLYRHIKLSLTLDTSVCYCYTDYEMTDQFL